ncbi:UDP-glucose 4-epimerase GalE [Streptomyces sp. NPDC048232]|uniref:UDP-glucose 4-epimerase GalE n=1 Tax=Streptomyces sp. NPDC048232 TaxID=3365520 RepID=UPI00370FDEBF
MSWLVTGGAGYIGAHVVRALVGGGEHVVVYDDLSTGSADRVPDGVPLVVGSVLDGALLEGAIRDHAVTGVVHIAGKKQVAESVERPLHYYRENVTGLATLLEAMTATGVGRLVFSSSAAVYGMPDVDLVTEDTPCLPLSPYGETKLAGEWLINAAARAHGIRAASLRYFNVAGAAAPELSDSGVFNLIPMVFERLEAGDAPRVFGDDYATPDGTCVRDYVHVEDIASAHLAAARRLADAPEGTALTLNVGRGEGSSVREMVDRILKVTGRQDAAPRVSPRRPGDAARVVASADRAREELGWTARHDLDAMIESAWQGWRHRHG